MPFLVVVRKGEGAEITEILAKWILEAYFLSGTCFSPVLLRSVFAVAVG